MGLFTLSDKPANFIRAVKMGLSFVGGQWEKFYPPRKRSTRVGKGHITVTPLFDNGGLHDTSKAICYARWLAERDGIHIPSKIHEAVVTFEKVAMHGFKRPVKQAKAVTFIYTIKTPRPPSASLAAPTRQSKLKRKVPVAPEFDVKAVEIEILIPHCGYDPTCF